MSFFLMVSKDLSDCHWIQLRGQERLNATPEESKRCKGAQPFRGEKPRAFEFNYRPFSYMTSIFLAHHQSSWNSSSRYWILNMSTTQHSSKESIARKSSKILVSGKFYNGSYNKLLCTSWVLICQTAVWANPRSSVRTDFGQDVYKQEDWLTRQLGNFDSKTVCEWQTQVSTEHWAVSTGHRVYNVYGLGIDLHAPRQSECWLTPARHLTPMFTNEHLHHQQHQQHQHNEQDHQWWRYHRRLLVYQSPYL